MGGSGSRSISRWPSVYLSAPPDSLQHPDEFRGSIPGTSRAYLDAVCDRGGFRLVGCPDCARVPGAFFALFLAGPALPAVAYSQPRAIEPGEDFPLGDHSVWLVVEQGLKNQAADLQLARAPESPETVALLLDAYRPGDALMVLRRIVDRHPERMGAAFKAASTNRQRFNDEGRGYVSVLREIVPRARQQLRGLPREQAAEAAWYLRFLDFPVRGETRAHPYGARWNDAPSSSNFLFRAHL